MTDGAPAGSRSAPGPGLWLLGSAIVAALVLAPIAALALLAAQGSTDLWQHLFEHVLPDAVRATATLLAGVALLTALVGTGSAWLVTAYDFPGRRLLDWSLLLPLCRSHVYRRLRLSRHPSPCRPRPERVARDPWRREPARLPTSRRAIDGGVHSPDRFRALPVRVSDRACDVPDAGRKPHRHGADSWREPNRRVLSCRAPAGAPGHRHWTESGADGSPERHRRVRVPRRAYADGVGLYHLGDSVGPSRSGPDRPRHACRGCGARGFRALGETPAPLRERRAEPQAIDPAPSARHARTVRVRHWRRSRDARLRHSRCVPHPCGLRARPLRRRVWCCAPRNDEHGVAFTRGHGAHTARWHRGVYSGRVYRSLWPGVFARIVSLGYAVPGTVLAIGVLPVVTNTDRLVDAISPAFIGPTAGLLLLSSGAALVYAYLARFLAVAAGGVEAGFSRVSLSLDDAARTLGETAGRRLRRIHLPMTRPALATAALLVFVDCMKELPATLLLRPLGFETLSTHLYGEAARGTYEEGAIAALLIVVAGLVPVLILARIGRTGSLDTVPVNEA